MAEDSRSFSAINPSSLAKYEARQADRDAARTPDLTGPIKKKKKKKRGAFDFLEPDVSADTALADYPAETSEPGVDPVVAAVEAIKERRQEVAERNPVVDPGTGLLKPSSSGEPEAGLPQLTRRPQPGEAYLSPQGTLMGATNVPGTGELPGPVGTEGQGLLNPLTSGRANFSEVTAANSQRKVQDAADEYRRAAPEDKPAAMQEYRNALLEGQAFGGLLTPREQAKQNETKMAEEAARMEADPGVRRYNESLLSRGINPYEIGPGVLKKGGGMDVPELAIQEIARQNAAADAKTWAKLKSQAAAYRSAYTQSRVKNEENPALLVEADRLERLATDFATTTGGKDPREATAGYNIDNANQRALRTELDNPNNPLNRGEARSGIARLKREGRADPDEAAMVAARKRFEEGVEITERRKAAAKEAKKEEKEPTKPGQQAQKTEKQKEEERLDEFEKRRISKGGRVRSFY